MKPLDWKYRHVATIIIATATTLAFMASRLEWSEMHRWNRAVGDASLILVSAAILIGPLSRLSARFRPLLPWRRELGIYGVVLAGIHTAIILVGWVNWDFARLFGFELHPQLGRYVMLKHGFGLANAIGIIALVYGLVLAATSNDRSQRFLSGPVWKFVQQGVYVLWALVLVHTAYFLYLNFLDFHRRVPDPNWAQIPFIALTVFVASVQLAAFLKTWRRRTPPVGGD